MNREIRNFAAARRLGTFTTLVGLTWIILLSVATPTHAADTFFNTGSLITARHDHTATLLPNGKVLVVGGTTTAGAFLASAELFDSNTGKWTSAGTLITGRRSHTATLLPNGKVLIAGGYNGGPLASVELYDPATGNWRSGQPLGTARYVHSATLLSNGKLLIAGGAAASGSPLGSAELYDPATGNWSATGSLTARYYHAATQLPDGRVLVVGGNDGTDAINSAEVYDPATGGWLRAAPLGTARYYHLAVLLNDGNVLVTGGTAGTTLESSELYDPIANSWKPTGDLNIAHSLSTATLLPNGKVLVAGGFQGAGVNDRAELYDPAAGAWSAPFSFRLGTGRAYYTATMLPNGRVLIVGGLQGTVSIASAVVYEPASAGWSSTRSLATPRAGHTATLLPNGKVLVAAGYGAGIVLPSAELYDSATGTWSATGTLTRPRYGHTATLLLNGKVLVVGGNDGTKSLPSAELYDPATGVWSATDSLPAVRSGHTATLLINGKVLVVGGYGEGNTDRLASAELYDPVTGAWRKTDSLATGRIEFTATLLFNGKVLVAGGYGGIGIGGGLVSAELYDPATGAWSATGSTAYYHNQHTATLFPDGNVMIAGGGYGLTTFYHGDLYDSRNGVWAWHDSTRYKRYHHTATLLPNGQVLVVGGHHIAIPSLGSLSFSDLYDPIDVYSGHWALNSAPTATGRAWHTSTLLPNGKLLVVGGYDSDNNALDSAELYDRGQGFAPAWRPQITSAAFDTSRRLVLTGTGFRGKSGASGGNGTQDSSTGYPLVQMRRLHNEQTVFLLPDPAGSVSATGFTSLPVPQFSDHALVTVIANGIPSVGFIVAFPDISVEQPVGSVLAVSGTRSIAATIDTPGHMVFTIKNHGGTDLTGLTISRDGPGAADFTVTSNPTAPVIPGGSTTFTVRYAPATPGVNTASLHIANNVPGKIPYIINLTGLVFPATADTDGDGMTDASELLLASLGFNWQVSQPAMVQTYYANAISTGFYNQSQYDASRQAGRNDVLNAPNSFDLYSLTQLQALNVGTPLLMKDPATGQFKLTIGVQKAMNPSLPFLEFPMNGAGASTRINGVGRLEFLFDSPDNAAFFRLESR